MADRTFTYQTGVYKKNGYYYASSNSYNTNVTVTDTPDSNADDTTQLGDVSNDAYTATSGASGTYLGKTSDGFIGQTSAGNYVFGNTFYSQGAKVASFAPDNTADSTTFEPLCFASGTQIATIHGDVVVDELKIGDIVVTASGALQPIRWLGHRRLACDGSASNMAPVRVLANAFGAGVPARDLMLSPGHPVLVGADADNEGGHLVPIMCLINGTTIERVAVNGVIYWHVELEQHDILLAEGLPAESYIDLGSRPWFAGAGGELHDPDMALPGMPGRCRPVAIDGPVVEAERQRLDGVFAMRLNGACAWPDEALLTFG